MKRKPYTAKTLSGAQAYVRMLLKQREDSERFKALLYSDRQRFFAERRTLARLAADGPCFHNPLEAVLAKQLRDSILRDECGLNPNGTPIARVEAKREGKANG